MFRYTAKKEILNELRAAARKMQARWHTGDHTDYLHCAIRQYCKTYSEYVAFSKFYRYTEYYSLVPVNRIPVGGYLFSVRLFTEEEVK